MWSRRRWLAGASVGALGTTAACSRTNIPTATLPPGGWVDDHAPELGHRWRDGQALAPSTDAPILRTTVAIVGAGVAGLSAARALRQSGIDDFQVFELAPHAGGNARGHTLGGLPCPLGAHYLPLPDPQRHDLRELLFELDLLRRQAGRVVPNERHLCHTPQERAWVQGRWQDGLLPINDVPPATRDQYRRFAGQLRETSRLGFSIPTGQSPWTPAHTALDAQTLHQWLREHDLDDPWLLALLDYACRDDFGAGLDAVSAWAGLHYFASRHGFHAPGETAHDDLDDNPVFTWPQGNAWITDRLAAPLTDRLHTQALVTHIDVGRHAVDLHITSIGEATTQRWQARQVIVCTPLFIAARLLSAPPAALSAAAAQLQYAPWLVSNLHLRGPLLERIGTAMAWDNVPFDPIPALHHWPPSLGYVNATHQSLQSVPGPTVLTHYWALGGATREINRARRQALLETPWTVWAQRVLTDMIAMHPDLPGQCTSMALQRWGHAMAIPTPGTRSHPALTALARPHGRVHFAHSDLSGYSVLEEAFTQGHRAGRQTAWALQTHRTQMSRMERSPPQPLP